MRRHFRRLRPTFNSFGAFLAFAIERSECDKHAMKHFRHSASDYMFEGDYETYMQELAAWENSDESTN